MPTGPRPTGPRGRGVPPASLVRSRAQVVLVGLSCTFACSTLETPPQDSLCNTDADCPPGQQCNLQIGGLCESEPQGLPPRAVLGFAVEDIAAGASVEVLACDEVVTTSSNELVLRRPWLFQTVALRLREFVERVGDVCPVGYDQSDADPGTCEAFIPGSFDLSQPSRLGRIPVTSGAVFDSMSSAEGEDGSQPLPAEVTWPIDFGLGDDAPFLVAATDRRDPESPGQWDRASIWRVVHREQTSGVTLPLSVDVRRRCQRQLTGSVREFGGAASPGEQRVELTFGESVASRSSVLPAGSETPCVSDTQCPPGEACNPSLQTCGVDLRGFNASVAVEASPFTTPLFTHCEADAQPMKLDLGVRYGPVGATPTAPTMFAGFVQPLDPGLLGDPLPKTDALPGDLCLPPWSASSPYAVELSASPVEVIAATADSDAWRCCDTGECLPQSGLEGATPPGETPLGCPGFSSMSLTSALLTDSLGVEPDVWEADGCLPLFPRPDGSVGRHLVSVSLVEETQTPPAADSYCQGSTCTLLMSGTPDATRTYRVDVEQPASSFLRSSSFLVDAGDPGQPLPPLTLEPRTILRGQVTCADGVEGCVVPGSTVIAERLRLVEEEDTTVLGPFIFSQAVLDDGSFFLPVNPGAYVFTTIPPAGLPGAPGDFAIIDARPGSDGVKISAAGVNFVDVGRDAVIRPGRSVRVQLREFDPTTRVLPFDLGSWASQPDWPTDQLGNPIADLNDPSTCYGPPDRGCAIRQINGGVQPLSSARAEFTVRDRGSSSCP